MNWLSGASLPCYLADPIPELVRIRGVIPEITTELWLLTHADLRGTARVRAVTEHLASALGEQRALFEGRASAAG